jgi:endonuclease YncB( thermonuclease family)
LKQILRAAGYLALCSLALSGAAYSQVGENGAQNITARNCTVTDGDTLRCGSVRIRLLGIDAAELPGHCRRGRQCAPGDPNEHRSALTSAAQGTLHIEPIKRDRYGRTIAIVANSRRQNLSCVMLASGATYKAEWDDGRRIALACPQLAKRSTSR